MSPPMESRRCLHGPGADTTHCEDGDDCDELYSEPGPRRQSTYRGGGGGERVERKPVGVALGCVAEAAHTEST
jgi:hypothetical protein